MITTRLTHTDLNEYIKLNLELFKKHKLICLTGDLGSGKTTFTQLMAKHLGINDQVSSPTFILQNEYNYNINGKFYHLDLYRIETERELSELKIEDLLDEKNIIVIEWADKFYDYINNIAQQKKFMPLWIEFKHISENEREVSL